MNSCGIVKFYLEAKIHDLRFGKASSLNMNLVPSVKFHYPTLVKMNDSKNLTEDTRRL